MKPIDWSSILQQSIETENIRDDMHSLYNNPFFSDKMIYKTHLMMSKMRVVLTKSLLNYYTLA